MLTDKIIEFSQFFHFSSAFAHTNDPYIGFLVTGALFCVAFLAGIIDSVAGGGGLLTIPAMIMAGLPPQTALGTNKMLSSMGTTMALLNFWRNGLVLWRVVFTGIAFTFIGASLGAKLVLILPPDTVGRLLVFLLPLGMAVTFMPKKQHATPPIFNGFGLCVLVPLVGLVVGCYDGFFGPGTGSFFILAFYFILRMNLTQASATTKAFNLASNISALAVFILNGKTLISLGILLGIANIGGNLVGSQLAVNKGSALVQRFLLLSLTILFASLIWKYWLH